MAQKISILINLNTFKKQFKRNINKKIHIINSKELILNDL